MHKRHRQADDGNSMEDEILTHEQSYEIECNKYGKIVVVTEIVCFALFKFILNNVNNLQNIHCIFLLES